MQFNTIIIIDRYYFSLFIYTYTYIMANQIYNKLCINNTCHDLDIDLAKNVVLKISDDVNEYSYNGKSEVLDFFKNNQKHWMDVDIQHAGYNKDEDIMDLKFIRDNITEKTFTCYHSRISCKKDTDDKIKNVR